VKAGATTFFPLFVLAILAGLSFWLRQATDVPLTADNGATRHDPDILVDNFIVHRMGPDGVLKYKLVAAHMEHYPDDDSNLIWLPHLTSYRPGAPDVFLSGKTALVTEKGARVVVRDDVVLNRPAFADRPEMTAYTPELTILPDDGRAFNQHPVLITQGESWIKGIGVEVDNNLGTVTLLSQVTGAYLKPRPQNPASAGKPEKAQP
jgi:lipopolysaccharide export system protein LptC